MKEIVLAADLGGTNLRVASVDANGIIMHSAGRDTPHNPDKIVNALAAGAGECLKGTKAERFCIAAAAIIDFANGRISKAPNIPSLNGFPLAAAVSEKIDLPVILENDANAAAVGEHWLGASKGYSDAICVTLGTGIGGGIILGGELFRGIDGTAGEIGHVCVVPEGHPCGCGSRGCVEQYASATAIARMAGQTATLTAKDVYLAAKAGDKHALAAFEKMGYYLGISLAGLINVLNPEIIVIGGGVAASWDLFIDHTLGQINKRAFREPASRVKLVRAKLGGDAGILGAARLGFTGLASEKI